MTMADETQRRALDLVLWLVHLEIQRTDDLSLTADWQRGRWPAAKAIFEAEMAKRGG